MKHVLKSLLPALALLAVSCGGSKSDPTPTEVPAPVLVSTTPADGTGGLTETTLSIVFTFDQNILCTPAGLSGITVDGGAYVKETKTSGANLRVEVAGLARGRSYVVTLPAGTVGGYKQNQKTSAAISFRFSMKDPDPVDPQPSGWESAASAARNMGAGWNLGNTLESNSGDVDNMWIEAFTERKPTDYENAWGQTDATRELIHMFKEAGFGAIRVPVTWYPHMDTLSITVRDNQGHWDKAAWLGSDNYTVDPVWMARVREVVSYVIDEGMYCILNVHHDTGTATTAWLRADPTVHAAVKDRYCALWEQIATEFESFGPKLLFESFNEMLDANNTWNYASGTASQVINAYNADFVNTVRKTGGNNVNRNLILNTYAASPDKRALQDFVLPKDVVEGHLLAEVHSYAPYDFAFDTSRPRATFDASCEREVRAIVEELGKFQALNGIPCVLGEFGVDTPIRGETEEAKQAACYVAAAATLDIPCFYWMGLSDGKEDRSAPAWTKPALRDAILRAWRENKNN